MPKGLLVPQPNRFQPLTSAHSNTVELIRSAEALFAFVLVNREVALFLMPSSVSLFAPPSRPLYRSYRLFRFAHRPFVTHSFGRGRNELSRKEQHHDALTPADDRGHAHPQLLAEDDQGLRQPGGRLRAATSASRRINWARPISAASRCYLIEEKKLSWSSFNNAVCALRFFYRVTLKKDWMIEHLPYGKRPKTLPVVLSKEEVLRLFAAMPNLNYRIILMTAYSAGLRVSEVARLRVEDIDRERMLIRVRQGKGRKDRYVPLSADAAGGAGRLRQVGPAHRLALSRGACRALPQPAHRGRACTAAAQRRGHPKAGLDAHACGTVSPPTCWSRGSTSARSRNCWGTRGWRRRRSTRT